MIFPCEAGAAAKFSCPLSMESKMYDNQRVTQSSVRLARALALIGSLAAGLAVFWGLRDILAPEGGLSSWAIPVAAATALACLLAGGWHMILGSAAEAKGHHAVVVLGLGTILTAITIATSAWWLATALGGSSAVRHHQQQVFSEVERASSSILDALEPERQIIVAVQGIRSGYEKLALAEQRHGVLSGRPGRGPVFEEVNDVARALLVIEQTMIGVFDQRNATIVAVRESLRNASRASTLGENTIVGEMVMKAINQLADARRMSVLELASTVQVIPVTSSADRLKELENLTRGIPELARKLGQNQQIVEMPNWEPVSRSEAVVRYADNVSLAWIVAVSLDLLPLLLLGVVVAAKARADDVTTDTKPVAYEIDSADESQPGSAHLLRSREA